MNEFVFYSKQGIQHITDLQGIDHMLFIVTLCAVYRIEQWRNILVLITAFTIGHSITLALTSLNIITINKQLVEVLIPITILVTCVYNVFRNESNTSAISLNYVLALFFGLIHGMGFSSFFKSMMMGISESIVLPLLSFNIGIEIGQLLIIALFMLLLLLFTKVLHVKHRDWLVFISGAGAGLAVEMILNAVTG